MRTSATGELIHSQVVVNRRVAFFSVLTACLNAFCHVGGSGPGKSKLGCWLGASPLPLTWGREHRCPPFSKIARGFTLLELLIVIFIIGITLSFAIINVTTSEQQEIEDEASRLMALIQLARENAILDAEDFAVAFTDKGYRFEKYDGTQWQPLDDAVLRFRPFSDDLKVEYTLQGKQALLVVRNTAAAEDSESSSGEGDEEEATDISELKGKTGAELRERKNSANRRDTRDSDEDEDDKKKKDKKKKEPEPVRIFLLSTGEVTPFEVFFRKSDHESGYRVSGSAVGEFKMTAVIKEIVG
jgi:type II secretion system protein H